MTTITYHNIVKIEAQAVRYDSGGHPFVSIELTLRTPKDFATALFFVPMTADISTMTANLRNLTDQLENINYQQRDAAPDNAAVPFGV